MRKLTKENIPSSLEGIEVISITKTLVGALIGGDIIRWGNMWLILRTWLDLHCSYPYELLLSEEEVLNIIKEAVESDDSIVILHYSEASEANMEEMKRVLLIEDKGHSETYRSEFIIKMATCPYCGEENEVLCWMRRFDEPPTEYDMRCPHLRHIGDLWAIFEIGEEEKGGM